MLKRTLLMHMYEIFGLPGLGRGLEVDGSHFDQVFEVLHYFVSRSDLLWKLPFVEHVPALEEGEDEDLPQECRGGVNLDGSMNTLMGCRA